MLTQVRHAAAQLEPVVVDLGRDQIQFQSYCDRVIVTATKRELLLYPITASLLPPHAIGPVSIHLTDAEEGWTLVARTIRPVAPRIAAVDLAGAQLVPRASNGSLRVMSGPKQLDLVTPRGVANSDAHVFPIVEIDANSCVVDAMTPFGMGEHLSLVEVVADQHVLRRCGATVRDIGAFCTADGSRRFRCKLEFCDETDDANEWSEVVGDPVRIRRIVEFAALASVCGFYEAPEWDRGTARLIVADRDALSFTLFPVPKSTALPHFMKLSFTLFAVDCSMTMRVLEHRDGTVRTALPLCLRRSRRFVRERQVSSAPQLQLQLRFKNPLTGGYDEHTLLRLSSQRMAFAIETAQYFLWEGLPLEDARVRWPHGELSLGDLRVEAIEAQGSRRNVEVAVLGAPAQRELTRLLSTLDHPDVRVHDGKDFRSMLEMYEAAGLLAPHMHSNLDPIIPNAKRVWQAMHQPDLDMVQTFVQGPDDAPDAALTVVRQWERAWLSQHFASRTQGWSGATGHLQLAVVDFIQRRSDGDYYMFFVKADNRPMNAFLERFVATTGTPEATERCTVQFWRRLGSRPAWAGIDGSNWPVTELLPNLERLVSRAAERTLGVNSARGLSLVPGEFQLPTTSEQFARAGIIRARDCSVIGEKQAPCWAVIEEISSQGFNLTWMLNANWLFPIHPASDPNHDGLRVALQHILHKPQQSAIGDVFINTTEATPGSVLEEAGFEKLADVYMYTLNRAGLNRYFHYTSDRYGEIDLRTQQRRSRRSGIQLRPAAAQAGHLPEDQKRKVI